jgi:hypothetical protein
MGDSKVEVHRRNFLAVFAASGVATAAPFAPAVADTETNTDKRKARYQANSPEVEDFYRVNRYPAK